MTKEAIYLDNNATTLINPFVLKAMNATYELPLNSSSAHKFGQIAGKYINDSKSKISKLINGENYKIIITSGATESNNIALKAFDNYQIITTKAEHACVLEASKKQNATLVNVDENGLIKLDELEEALKAQPNKDFLVSVIFASNETGVITNLKAVAKLVHQYGGLIHSDLTQGPGKVELDFEDLNLDLASFSAHKINGPQGVGALAVRNSLSINPLMYGGLQEDGKRPGTTNIAGIVGFGEACKIAQEELGKYQEIATLRDYLESEVIKVAGQDVVIFGKSAKRLPNTSFFATSGLDNQTLMIALDMNNVAVSIGSACSSGVSKSSHVLHAMGVDEKLAKSAIRVSLGKDNTKQEVDKFIEIWSNLYFKNNKN
jgi:cysteine desulfurase